LPLAIAAAAIYLFSHPLSEAMFAKTAKYLKDVTRNSKNVVRLAKSTLNAGKQASTLFRMCSTFSRYGYCATLPLYPNNRRKPDLLDRSCPRSSLIKNANKTPFIGMSAMFGASIVRGIFLSIFFRLFFF
jgi:hypothetical protein